jgi:hypothetical protein
MFIYFSDNNSDNFGTYVNWIEIRSTFFCEYENQYVRVNE